MLQLPASWRLSAVTVFAFEVFYFVKNVNFSVPGHLFVTTGTGSFTVLSFEREKSFGVVETAGRDKGFRVMAAAAVTESITVELAGMNIGMTGGACARKTSELMVSGLVRVPEMAGTAGCPGVSSFQEIACDVVVKGYRGPSGFLMAGTAILPGIVLFPDLSQVDIVMAIHTPGTQRAEPPGCIVGGRVFQVTGDARGCQVSSLQWEGATVVPFNRIIEGGKPLGGMAFGAIGRDARPCKLTPVIVGVAVVATAESRPPAGFPGMTLVAGHLAVATFQTEPGQFMVELVAVL